MKRSLALLLVLAAACTGGGSNPPSPPPHSLSITELKLRVLDALRLPFDYCDPDMYPVGHGTPLSNAKQHIASVRNDRAVFDAILAHDHISSEGSLSDGALIRVYTQYKEIAAIPLRSGGGTNSFNVYVSDPKAGYDRIVAGTVSPQGKVDIGQLGPANTKINCPICLASAVRIATPGGSVPVTRIRVGMTIWSTDRAGRRIRAVVLETRRRRAVGVLLRIALADGRTVVVSPGHPTAGGLLVGGLVVGDRLSGSTVSSITRIRYVGFTYDLLPSGPTGAYFADGVLLGSTLAGSDGPAA